MITSPSVAGVLLLGVLFTLVYFPALKLTLVLVSPYPKASLGRRFVAAAIDGLLVASWWVAPWNAGSVALAVAGALYLLLRDAFGGQSIGKLFVGLIVVHVDTGQRCGLAGSIKRNVVLVLPGANLVAALLEARTLVYDPQGQRLGDRLAHTQVVEGLGARDLVKDLQDWWASFLADLPGAAGRPGRGRVPVRVPPRRSRRTTQPAGWPATCRRRRRTPREQESTPGPARAPRYRSA
jgi:uncharacterized RDD family membrane protein YckC